MQKLKKHGPGTITSITLSEEINDLMKIIQAIGDSDILLKGVTETIENKTNKQEMVFLGTLVGTLGSISLGIILSWKGFVRAGPGNNKGKKIVRAADGKKMEFLTRPHPLTNFEIKAHYQNGPKFNGTYSRNNLPKKYKGWGIHNKSWWICRR